MAIEASQGVAAVPALALMHQNNDATLSALILDDEQPLTDTSPLTRNEEQMLEHCETVIQQTVNSFFQLGEALAIIRRMRLYRAEYSSFEEYCRNKWNFGRQRATQIIQAHNAAAEMVTSGYHITDLTERQMRPLVDLSPEVRAEVLDKAAQLAGGGRRTSRHIQDALKAIQLQGQPEQTEMVLEAEIVKPTAIDTAVEMPRVTLDMLTGCFDEINELLDRVEYPDSLRNSFGRLRSMVVTFAKQTTPIPFLEAA